MSNDIRTMRDMMSRNDEAAREYWDEAFSRADDEARANLAYAYNADN